MNSAAIVLPADRGTRMILHEICGRPLIGHVIEAVLAAFEDVTFVAEAPDAVRYVLETFGERVHIAASAPAAALVIPANAALFDADDTRREIKVIDDLAALADAEETLYAKIANAHRRAGVVIRGAARIDRSVAIEPGAIVEHGVVLRGNTSIATGARIDIGCVLTDVDVAADAYIKPYSVCSQSTIGRGAQIGPFAHLRVNSRIEAGARIGNFVETKEVLVREGAMANHLAFLGDGDIGEHANIGAGTIFCNSDGIDKRTKHRTEVGAGASVGSACQLLAPVTIGAGAMVAAGTAVTDDVPPDAMAIGRARQVNKDGYAAKLRAKADVP
jgi:bifunctional UDP-N-acetylglucosamine pyrophosphorylase / glucosamine-1-phosphate N-acetyltransferase